MTAGIRKAILTSLIIQGIGSLAPLVTVIALARVAGPHAQGTFSAFKTWMDLVSSLVIFGFPQAFVYLINKSVCTRTQLLNATIFYVTAGTLIVAPVAALSLALGYTVLPAGQSVVFYSVVVALGMGPVILNRLVRGIYLTIDDGFLFSLVTSAPTFFLMVTVLAAGLWDPFRYDLAFLAAGFLTLVATWPWLKRIIGYSPGYRLRLERIPFGPLAEQSLQTFLQSVAFALQPVIAIYILQRQGSALTAVAFFTAATIILVAVNILFGLVAPILFNRWSAAMDDALLRRISRYSLMLAGVFGLLGTVSVPVLPFIVPMVFGADYGPAAWAFQAMAIAIAPVAFTRSVYPAVHAAGQPSVNTASCIVRLASGGVAQICMALSGFSPLVAAVGGWVIAEWAAALYSFWALRRTLRWTS